MVYDITERKRAEKALKQQSERLAALLETSQTLSTTLDMTTVLQGTIDRATRLLEMDTGAFYLLKGDELFLGATTPPIPPTFPDVFRRAPLADQPHIRKAAQGRYNG